MKQGKGDPVKRWVNCGLTSVALSGLVGTEKQPSVLQEHFKRLKYILAGPMKISKRHFFVTWKQYDLTITSRMASYPRTRLFSGEPEQPAAVG